MKASEIREKYMEFFEAEGHRRIGSASLVPENDPTVLFTTAGMHPLVPFLLGEAHPLGQRLVNCQKCVRTGDIDEVGDGVHLTFFEMLGNWSLGDYFKKDAIEFSYEFLCGKPWLGIPENRIAVSVFAGDSDAPFDDEAYSLWRGLGIPVERIAKCSKKDNWWGPAGQTGPCGPDTEMFIWTGKGDAPLHFDTEDSRWVEVWNDVFMQYNKTGDDAFVSLSRKNVDTGMGLERVAAVLQDVQTVYETELFLPIFERIRAICGKDRRPSTEKTWRIIADHLRAAVFIAADGVSPGNVDQGYVLRRLLRRSIREGRKLGMDKSFVANLAATVVEEYSATYPELSDEQDRIRIEFETEEEQFAQTLKRGTREFFKLIGGVPEHVRKKVISGKNAFKLYDTYGFPLELTEEMAGEQGFEVDVKGFQKAFKKHQEISRRGAEQKFKGGLADDSRTTTALHTATHLMHQALRQVLGPHVEQRGSNITAERLRFDFSHPEKLSQDELDRVEGIVNGIIKEDLPVECVEMDRLEALESGAIGLFADRYGDRVKVFRIGNFSSEICGGPHVERTGELGAFSIIKEESSSKGVRRIKARLS